MMAYRAVIEPEWSHSLWRECAVGIKTNSVGRFSSYEGWRTRGLLLLSPEALAIKTEIKLSKWGMERERK